MNMGRTRPLFLFRFHHDLLLLPLQVLPRIVAAEVEPCFCDPVRSRAHVVRHFEIFTVSALHSLVHANVILLQQDSHPCFWSNCTARLFLYPSFFLWASRAS